ncbi:hypothetical protein [Amycolatopsis sp.]|uniref:hypothetical protein n=1 Tax=Amycolatopsis sp. TaxID=37632 RepID=UPI002B925A4B|nr:hypothetical protein [Amycolatopsis sp.]HVV10264.1 hypothetical protein [Amycolatopsis sp.]
MLWRIGLSLCATALTGVLLACSVRVPDQPPAAATPAAITATTTTTTKTSTIEHPNLAKEVTDAVTSVVPGTSVSFVLYDKETGQTPVSVNAGTQRYTASVVKLLIAMDALHTGGWHAPSNGRIAEMLSLSDDGVADSLWAADGQGTIVTRMARLIGLKHTTGPRIADQWEMTSTTADDLAAIYRYLTDEVPAVAADPLLDALAAAKNPAADGFQQYFGIPDGLPGRQWAVKQGWMEIQRSVVLNTTGIVDDRYIVVLLAELPAGTSFARGRPALTAGISAIAPALPG